MWSRVCWRGGVVSGPGRRHPTQAHDAGGRRRGRHSCAAPEHRQDTAVESVRLDRGQLLQPHSAAPAAPPPGSRRAGTATDPRPRAGDPTNSVSRRISRNSFYGVHANDPALTVASAPVALRRVGAQVPVPRRPVRPRSPGHVGNGTGKKGLGDILVSWPRSPTPHTLVRALLDGARHEALLTRRIVAGSGAEPVRRTTNSKGAA